MHAAEVRDGLVHQALHLGGLGDVGDDAMRLQPVVAQRGGGGFGLLAQDVGDDDLRALFGQAARGGGAQPSCRAGDDGDFVLDLQVHACFFPSMLWGVLVQARSTRPALSTRVLRSSAVVRSDTSEPSRQSSVRSVSPGSTGAVKRTRMPRTAEAS